MADRFPSLDDIDAGQTEVNTSSASQGDFLSRERAVLGEDADLFTTNDSRKVTLEDADDDLLGDFSSAPQAAADADDLDDFESSFPAVSTQNDNVGPGGTITNTSAPFQGSGIPMQSSSGYTNYTPSSGFSAEPESEPVRQWREKRDADLGRRDQASRSKKEETVATAQKDIDSFYESYNRKVDRQKEQTKKDAEEFLANREDTTAGGTSWERIAKLVDLSGKGQIGGGDGSTKKRMREMLLSLKADKDAPGAAGV